VRTGKLIESARLKQRRPGKLLKPGCSGSPSARG
jgi:hypothetical protein